MKSPLHHFRRLEGHYWTIAPSLSLRRSVPVSRNWSTHVASRGATIRITGAWRPEESDTALIVVHGITGSVDRPYCRRAAKAAQRRGWSCLRLALRGADRLGEDFYHAGQTDDLKAAIASAELRGYRRIFGLGYSLGGHIALRYALEAEDERVRAVAAICPPLDLALGVAHLDRQVIYRRHILRGLREIYSGVAQRGPVPTPLSDLEAVDSVREWDARTVVPRYGFRNVEDYYSTQSVGPHLARLHRPALVVAADFDPMIPIDSVQKHAQSSISRLHTWWLRRGGHVGYPGGLRRGSRGPSGVEDQVLEWMETCS